MISSLANFSGLASGVQWRDLIDQVIALESRPATRMQEQVTLAQKRSSAWADFKTRVSALNTAGAALRKTTALLGAKASFTTGGGLSSASVAPGTTPGSWAVRVLAAAAGEKLGSDVFASRTSALGSAGELRINGRRIEILATDTLEDVAKKFNAANSGITPSRVSASIVSGASGTSRLVLTSERTGAAGIDLVDGSGVLTSLGFTDTSVAIKTATSSGALSDVFADSATSVASLLGFTGGQAGTVTIGGVTVALDLSTMSLDDIAAAINNAAGQQGKAVTVAVVADTATPGRKRLEISGTTSFTDAGRVLESLGVLRGGRSAIAQQIQGSALTVGPAATPASASTPLTAIGANPAQAGDTLTIAGTRADGTAFSIDYTIGASDTMQSLVDRLNDPTDGLKAGTRTATVSIAADGSLTLTDDTGGDSRLALAIVSHNESGGTLDFGAFNVTTAGRSRQVAAGADAEIEVDGTYIRSSTNSIASAIQGVTLNIASAAPSVTTNVTITRDVDAAAAHVKAFVDAYNAVARFVDEQSAPSATGQAAKPLYGQSVLRSMRTALRQAMETRVPGDVNDGLTRLSDIGITIGRDGRYTVDDAKLTDALTTNSAGVAKLFADHGVSDVTSLAYRSSTSATRAGSYQIDITQAAAQGSALGAAFSGVYSDDATPDTLTIRDIAANKSYAVQLADGMTTAQIVDALNSEFATPKRHVAALSGTMYGDAVGTAATDATKLDQLFDGSGNAFGSLAGDRITIIGNRPTGGSFVEQFDITDPATQTLGDLRAAVQQAVGGDVTVAFVNGVLTVTANNDGPSQLALSITSDNAGGGTLSFGTSQVMTQGRNPAVITALEVGGQLQLTHQRYGGSEGFEVSFTDGGAGGWGALGLAAGTYAGTDVAGTIGGFAATGAGRDLTGAAGSIVEGLGITYTGAGTGLIGTFTFSRGIGASAAVAADTLLGSGFGSIDSITSRLETNVERLNRRIEDFNVRIARRRDSMVQRYTAMEQLISRFNTQSQWLERQLKQFDTSKS